MLDIPHLAGPEFSPHCREIERQLVQDYPAGSSIDWLGSNGAGPVLQLRGDPLQAADNLQLVDPQGKTLLRGPFRFLILTPEQQLRAFWMQQEGIIADRTWNALTPEQRRHLVMDCRNQPFRDNLDSRGKR